MRACRRRSRRGERRRRAASRPAAAASRHVRARPRLADRVDETSSRPICGIRERERGRLAASCHRDGQAELRRARGCSSRRSSVTALREDERVVSQRVERARGMPGGRRRSVAACPRRRHAREARSRRAVAPTERMRATANASTNAVANPGSEAPIRRVGGWRLREEVASRSRAPASAPATRRRTNPASQERDHPRPARGPREDVVARRSAARRRASRRAGRRRAARRTRRAGAGTAGSASG